LKKKKKTICSDETIFALTTTSINDFYWLKDGILFWAGEPSHYRESKSFWIHLWHVLV